nr:sigma-54 dependent transcriptional regulator [uncultured Porphyromonas sp.]
MNVDIQQIKHRFGIIGNSPLLDHAIRTAVQVAPTDMSVLVIGESGVGKESFPKIIHQNSVRKHGPYIAVNCGAIPEGTIDSELFGHLKGSFTGAITDRKGYFQEASGGTIFLDEVGELPLATQARLLRVLETGEFIPVGASQALKTDVRIVAATNVNLQEAVERGRFREDLLFRLNTVPIEVPPLRNRPQDIPLLFRLFASLSAERYHMPPLRLTPEATKLLEAYRWPGNIRELRNLTDRISVLEEERTVTAETVERYLPKAPAVDYHPALRQQAVLGEEATSFANEREILYQVLFDMKKDMAEMKSLVAGIMRGDVKVPSSPKHVDYTAVEPQSVHVSKGLSHGEDFPNFLTQPADYTPVEEVVELQHTARPTIQHSEVSDFEEQPLSLEEAERSMIQAALARHGGRRRKAAEDLKISERTLYRKIKEYGLEE